MSSVSLTKSDLENIEVEQKQLAVLDNQLLSIRKTAIFNTLKESSAARITMIKKMKSWIEILEKKIFDPTYMDELSVKETMNLFKYINNSNMRVLSEIDKLEVVLNAYAKADVPDENKNLKTDMEDMRDLKKSIMDKMNTVLKGNISDADIVNEKTETKFKAMETDMKKELEDLELEIDKLDLDNL